MIIGVREVVWPRMQAEGRWMVGDISIKIKLTAFCMHLTLFNQVDVYVEFCYLLS